MLGRWRHTKAFKGAALFSMALQFVVPPLAIAAENSQIVTDGQTATSLSVNGTLTRVTTETVSGRTGLNSFSVFNVFEGNQVDLILPENTDSLINMVHQQRTTIDGVLNAYKDGKIGGDVYFLNPFGVLVGQQGVINAGSLKISTPTPTFMQQMFAGPQVISAPAVQQVLDNGMPISATGLIEVRGQINAVDTVRMAAGSIDISGTVQSGETARIAIDQLVNLGGGDEGGIVDMAAAIASIDLQAEDNISISGSVIADGKAGQNGGDISITADTQILMSGNANVSASGQGIGSDGGTVYVMADGESIIQDNARLAADGGLSGDGGFVEFSAVDTVTLAGGTLSADALSGTAGSVLIDPDTINVSVDMLRDSTSNGGVSWTAGSLTLQADSRITVADDITISSRRVANDSSASAHRNDASIADSGDITLQAPEILLGDNATITAKGDSGFAGGTVTLDADSDSSVRISLNNAEIYGDSIVLDADAVRNPTSNYSDFSSTVSANIILDNGSVIGDSTAETITITAATIQGQPAYTAGVLVNTDIREALTNIDLAGVAISAQNDITINSSSIIQTDMSNDGWAQLGTLAPLSIAVALTTSKAELTIDGTSSVTSTSGDLTINSEADTQSTIYTQANSLGVSLVGAISVTENIARTEIGGTASLSAADNLTIASRGNSQITAVADASSGLVGDASGSLSVGVGVLRDNTTTRLSDGVSVTSTGGDVNVLADSQVQSVFAARAGSDDNFTQTAKNKFNSAIDDTDGLNQTFLGVNIGGFLKDGVGNALDDITSSLGPTGGTGGFQLAGAIVYADVKNETEALVEVDDTAASLAAPSLTAADAINIRARGITQSQSFATGRTDDEINFGAAAGIAIQKIENRLYAKAKGSNLANVNLNADNLTIAALTEAYGDNVSDTNRFGVYGASGVGSGGSDSYGIAGAIAIGINNINEVDARLGDNTSATIDNDVVVKAVNTTEAKVKADGSKNAIEASGRFMATLKNETPADSVISTKKSGGKLGVGASVAFNIIENTANAVVEGGATLTNTDNLTVTAGQTGITEAEARSAGAGGVSIVPLAGVAVARNNALAQIQSGSVALTTSDNINLSSTQTVLTTSVGNGAATAGGDSARAAVGISAGITVAFDSNQALIERDLTAGGDVSAITTTSHDIQSGAQSSADVVEAELIEDAPEEEEEEPDNATNTSTEDALDGTLGLTNGFSNKTVNVDVIKDKLSTDFAKTSGGGTGLGNGDGSDSSESKKVAIAGAFGVSYAESEALAKIADNITIEAGSLSVIANKNTDITATGDASTSGSDYNIGGGVGLNIATSTNRARIGTGTSITAGDLTVSSGMLSQVNADNETDSTNLITAAATSGSGTGEVAIAGAIALNVVLKNENSAEIAAGATLDNISGDIAITATSDNDYSADSLATVGKTLGLFAGIDAALSGLQDISVWTSHLSTQFGNLLQSTANQAFKEAGQSDDGGDEGGGGGDDGGTGLGAGISLNIILDDETSAVIEDNVTVGGTAQSLTVASEATTEMITNAVSGAKPGSGSDPGAKTSLDAAVAIGVMLKENRAYVGTGGTLNITDNSSITATNTSISKSTTKGEVTASETAVGATVSIGVVLEDTEAALNRSLTSTNGGLAVRADSDSTDIVLADAVAAGAVLDKYTNKLGVSKGDLLGSGSSPASSNETPDSMSGLSGDFTGGKSASFDVSGSETDAGGMGGDNKKQGSINIAAAASVSWADHDVKASIGDNVTISTAGDVTVAATNDANYRTRGSGLAVFSSKGIGVGVGLLVTSQNSYATVGTGSSITTSNNGDIDVSVVTSENQGTDPDNSSINFGTYASAEGIAGAGGGELGIAGSLALVYSDDEQSAIVGADVVLDADGSTSVTSEATNKIVTRAWAAAVASDATCDNPGQCSGNGSGDRTAVGAGIAVNIVLDNNSAEIGEDSRLEGDNVSITARDLSPNNAAFTLDPSDGDTTTEDYIQANYTAQLQNSSYYAEAIAGAGAQDGNAIGGSLAFTLSLGGTKAIVGEGTTIQNAGYVNIEAYNESDARHLAGAIALSSGKKAVGASLSGIYLREDVQVIVGDDGAADNGSTTTISASNDITIDAEADQSTLTFLAAGGISTNDLALSGALGVNVMDTDVEARITEDALIETTGGSVGVNADSFTDIRNFAVSITGSGGGNSVGGTLAVNLFLTDKKAIIGTSSDSDNNIDVNAANAVNVGVTAKQEIVNGIISASVSTSDNAISGALSTNVVKGQSLALTQQDVDINTDSSINSASSTQSVEVKADDNTTITDLTGTLAASNNTSVGVALGANVFWKDVQAGINGNVTADDTVAVLADTRQNLTATVVGIAGSSGGLAGAGSVSVGIVKSTTNATIGSESVIDTDGSVQVHAGDDTDIFMLEPAASFSTGGNALAGAVGAAVFVGSTKARILDNATITAKGNSELTVEKRTTQTSSPLLEGLKGGGDNETRDALGDFNDNFTFDNIKDLFLTETRDTETKRGVSVTAVSDQDVISIAASGAVSSDNAIAISLSAGVGINTTEASIGDATINNSLSGAHDDQDVTVRGISDTYWVDLSAALGVGTGTAGVGIGADVVVQVKNTSAFIAEGATVKANRNVEVLGYNRDKIINSAATIGVGNSAGVAGTASVGVLVNNTTSYIGGTVEAQDNITVEADVNSDLIQIAGAVGGGGTAGIGASFGVAYVRNVTKAYITDNATTDAYGTTSVTADTEENSIAAVLAGGIGGTVGVSVSAGIKVHQSDTQAYTEGDINQNFTTSNAQQDVVVSARNDVTTIDVTGGIGGGGTVGVGVTLNALVVHNKAQAWIGGTVDAGRDVSVSADSSKTTKNFTLAGAAGGTVSVAGNVAVILVGAEADEETDSQMTGSGDSNLADSADERQRSLVVSDILNDDNSSGDYSRTGSATTDAGTYIDDKQDETQIGAKFNDNGSDGSLNQTKAFIKNGASVQAARDVTVSASDVTNSVFTAGALGGAGVVGVGVTVGVLLVNNTAEAYIGRNADVDAGRTMLVKSRTAETVGSGAISAGGAGITSVQGVVMAQVTKSTTRAYINDNATINATDNSSDSQSVSVLAESDTELTSVSGSGGGALVGVGITGDAVVLNKTTEAFIGEDASVASGGDVAVDAKAETDIIQVALSINGGLVGVTGAAGVAVANNTTRAKIGDGALVYADDSIRVQARDDTEMDAVVITGAGGAVGVSGSVGVYTIKSVTEALIGENADIRALAESAGDGIEALTGTVDNSTTSIVSKSTRDQDGEVNEDNFTQTTASFGEDNISGLSVAAVTYEDINFAPIGVAGGIVGVSGVVATTVSQSQTKAEIGTGTTINDNNTGAGSAQDVKLLAASETSLNNISAGIGGGAVGVTFDIDTQVFSKTVSAKLLGDAKAERDVSLIAKSTDHVYQTATSIAVGGVAVGGIVGVSVISDSVTAEIGDNVTIEAGDDITVAGDQNINLIQTLGNVAVGGDGAGSSLGILIAKSSNTARIGEYTSATAGDELRVAATTDIDINQNIIGFGGGVNSAIVGSLGVNVLETSTTAEIDNNASINQSDNVTDLASQDVIVSATDNVTTQGAAGAAAIAGSAGVGLGFTATVNRNAVKARIGNNVTLSAEDDVQVTALSEKHISNQGIAFGGGVGLGAAGSVALTLIGGTMSDNASDATRNDRGNMISEVATEASQDRQGNDNDDDSAKNNTRAYTESYDNETNQLVIAQTSSLQTDIEGSGSQSTLAEIGSGSVIDARGDVDVTATEEINLSQIAGGASVGTVGVGGFVAVADYNGSVTARIGDDTVIDNVSSLDVKATIESGDDITIDLPDSDTLVVKAVNSTVIGASVGIAGLAAGIAQTNLTENANATIGDNVTVTTYGSDEDITIDALRDVDAQVNVVAVAGGVIAAGISSTGITASGNAIASIGANSQVGTNSSRAGDILIRARNSSTQTGRAVSAGAGFYGAAVGAIVRLEDTGTTRAQIGSGTSLYAGDTLKVQTYERARNYANAVGVAVSGGVALGVISSKVTAARSAETLISDNATLVGDGITLTSTVGEAGQRIADSDVTGASGGALVGVTGSESIVTASAGSKVQMGNAVTLRNHQLSGSDEVAGNDLTISSQNLATIYNDSDAFAIGAAALGVHITRSSQSGNSEIITGSGLVLDSKSSATLSATSARDTKVVSVAGAGGAIAATGGEAIVTHVSNARVIIGDGTSSTGADIDVSDNLSISATNDDTYDASIDAGAVALAGVTGAKLRSTGSAATQISIGDYADVRAHQVEAVSRNDLEKGGLGDNFKFDGGGAISVTVGDSRTSQSQSSTIAFGEFSNLYVEGTRLDQGHLTLTASNLVNAEDSAKLNTGALIGVPVSDTRITSTSNAKILLNDNATLQTQRGDITLTADTVANITAHAKTSVWGLAGVGATGKSAASLTSVNDITLDNGSTLLANGYMYLNSGKKLSGKSVTAKTDIYNNTLIAGIFGEKADATLNHQSNINIYGGASVKSARHMKIRAESGIRNASGDGFKEWLQFIGIAVVPLTGDFGKSKGSSSSKITLDGALETGVYNTQFIGFGKDFAAGDNVSVGSYSDGIGSTVRSGEDVTYTVDENRSLAQTVDAEITELYADWAASKSSDADNYTQTKINQITAQKNALAMDNASDDSDYDGTVSGLQGEISDAQAIIDNTSGTETTSSIAAAELDKQDAQEALDYVQGSFDADNFSYVAYRQQELQIIIDNLNAVLSASGDSETNQNMQTELAFLNAKKASLNTDPVDVIQVDDLFAATGNVLLYADTLTGASSGSILSQKDVDVTVRNDSVNPLEILNIYIPDDPGGSIYFNEQVVRTGSDVNAINAESGASANFSMTSDHGNFNPVVTIKNRFNARSSAYNPGLSASVKSPELLLSDNITNTGGLVDVSNKYGSVFQSATINAGELKLVSGGALFIADKGNGVSNRGPHPTEAFASYVDPRENSPGQGTSASSTGGCSSPTLPCTVANVSQDNQSSYTIAGGKIFISANTVNLNGLIQSGIAEKSITIGSISDPWTAFRSSIDTNGNGTLDGSEWTDVNGNGSFDLGDLSGTYIIDASADNGTFSGSDTTREVTGLFDAEYNADDDVVTVSGLEASGGEVFIAGKLISTGKGQINVVDGYASYTINNNSGKDIRIDAIDAGEVEGKVTLIDNFKLNSDNLSYVTQYTRIGNDIKVHTGYGAATTDSSSSYTKTNDTNGEQRLTNYTPEDGARYYWMSGEEVDYTKIYRTREVSWGGWFGINFYTSVSHTPHEDDLQSTLIDPDALPKADYAQIDTSIGDEYRFRKRFEEHSYAQSLASGYGSNPDVSCKNYVFVKKCTTIVYTQVDQTGNLYYYHDVTADRQVDIRFIGSDTGSVTVNSNAGIQLNGTIKNRTGTTTLSASDGITVTNDNALLDTANLSLTASGGSIGTGDNVLQLQQTDGSTISATASNGVYLRNEKDNMTFTTLDNTAGNINLWAGKSIVLNTASTALQGDNITLYSQYGEVRDTSGNAIQLNTINNGILNVRSRAGDIKLQEQSGDLYIESIDTIGNVEITTDNGSILDANTQQTNDEATQAALLGLWEELGLTGDNASTKRDEQVASYKTAQESLYRDYFELRNVTANDNSSSGGIDDDATEGSYSYDAYDADFEYDVTSAERENLQSNRFADEMTTLYNSYWELRGVTQASDGSYIAEAYDPNFAYTATAEERDALDNDAAAIADFEAEKIADYQQGHTKFGSGSYEPGYEYSVVQSDIDGFASNYASDDIAAFEAEREARYQEAYAAFGDIAYFDNFSYDGHFSEFSTAANFESTETYTNMTDGYVWSDDYLEAPLPGQSFKEVTDSTAFIETANIIGDNITLTINNGNIGTFTDTDNFTLTEVQAGTLDNASKVRLMAAEADDIELVESTGLVLLTQREDIDIKTLNSDSVVQVNVPQGYAFLGGETSVNISSVTADGELRFKVNGDILNIRGDTAAAVQSETLVLEAATGSIGTSSNVMYLDVADNFKMTARAGEGLWITEKTGDMQIGQIYSPKTVVLESPGQILDIDLDGITDIKGDIVNLTAATGIGTLALSSDNRTVEAQKALEIQTVRDNSTFTVNIANGGSNFYIEKGKFSRLTNVTQTGDLVVGMGTGSTLYAAGSFSVGSDNITVWGGTGGLDLDMQTGLNTNGGDMTVIGGGNASVAGILNTAGGELTVSVIDNATFTSTAAIDTDSAEIVVAAGNGISQSGSMTTDNATVSLFAGDNRTASRAANLTQAGTITTGGANVILQSGDNSSFGDDYWVQAAELTQSGTITTSGGSVKITSAQDILQSGTITTSGAFVQMQSGDTQTALENATLTQTGTITTSGGSLTASSTADIVASGTVNSDTGQIVASAGRNFESLSDFDLTTNGANTLISVVDNLTVGGTLATAGGDFTLDANTVGSGQQIRLSDNASVSTAGGVVTILSDAGLSQDLTFAPTATINAGSGRFDIRLSGEASITGLTTTNATDNAALVVARTIQDSGDVNADLTMNSNGNIDLRAFKYINLNEIDYNGSEPLEIDITSGNPTASTAGAVLDIDAEAGINVNKLYARNSSITAAVSELFTIADGQVNNNTYLNIGDFDARIGRLEDNSLVPASWVESGDNGDFFVSASATTGIRAEDYRCTGNPGYIGDANQVLNFSFSYNNPNVDCSGTLAFYRNPYVLVSPVQTVEQRLNTILSDILNTNMQILQQRQVQPLVAEVLGGGDVPMNVAAQALIVDAVNPISSEAADAAEDSTAETASEDIAAIAPVVSEDARLQAVAGFGVRAATTAGVIGISDVTFVNLNAPATAETDSDEDDEDDAPLAEDDGEDTQPLAGEPASIGPLSLLQ